MHNDETHTYPPHPLWFIVDYEDDWYGLKGGDGIVRGIPEGSRADWQQLLLDIRDGEPESRIHRRLAYCVDRGVYSPRNSNEPICFHMADPVALADLLTTLLNNPLAWTEDGLPKR